MRLLVPYSSACVVLGLTAHHDFPFFNSASAKQNKLATVCVNKPNVLKLVISLQCDPLYI